MLQLDEGVQVDVEPFELFESTAWALVRASVLAHEAALAPAERGGSDGGAPFGYDAVFSNVRSHRVLLPAWVVQYPHLLERFRVFVNGATGDAAGVQQFSPLVALTRLGSLDASGLAANVDAVARALRAAQRVLPPQMVVALLNGALALARPLFKVLLWPPLLVASAATLGVFALSSAMRHRQQRAELAAWEEQRAVERRLQATMTDEWRFKPQGEAAGGAQQQPRKPLPPPVDAGDCYAVLGIASTGASEEDVKAAFRRELMRYHPDHQDGDGGFDAQACSDRTRAIIAAYTTLRDKHRRAAYDASYRPGRRR